MSIAVPLPELPAAIAARTFCYVVTVSDAGRPHLVAVPVRVEAGELVAEVGASTVRHVAERAEATLVFPPVEPASEVPHLDHTLIVDGEARVAGERSIALRATWAVLHRPAPTG